jgi:hypothetical protein
MNTSNGATHPEANRVWWAAHQWLSKAKRRLPGDLVFLRLIRPGPLANDIATYLLIGFGSQRY